MAFRASNSTQLGHILRGFRRELGLSQAQVAERIGLAQNDISRIETGSVSPTTDRLFKLLSALELNMTLESKNPSTPDDTW